MLSAVIVADTSVIINFLRIDRMDLIELYPRRVLVTDHVEAEITESYPDQRLRFLAAIKSSNIDICAVRDPKELELFVKLRSSNRLGNGECSAIAVAMNRKYGIAIDDNKAVKTAIREIGMSLEIIRTTDVMLGLIRGGNISIEDADKIKRDWEDRHRFRIKAASFRDLI
jgi:predicted nucleic acid-binding protein